ncbi:MAG: LysR substrate-binding domain-containing protein [Burkholderiaceae bacterium]|nr:LysR substrate-binding domain-containing protein [Burkholderiaceae bacterium]
MKSSLNMGQIEAFRSVMLVGTVIGAARLMNITQPGVSRSIGLLELRIGYKLFERHGRRLVPTPEAEALYREIEPLYGSLDRIAEIAQDIRFQRAGALRIGTLPALSQWLVPQGIARFLSSRPKVSVFVESLPSRQIAERVSTRQLDVGIVELPLFRSAITIEPMEPLPFVAVIPAAHRLAGKSMISLKDLDGERMVLLARQSFVRHQIDDVLASLGVEPNVVLETPSSTIACALVAAGAGITLVGRLTATPFAGLQVAIRPIKETFTSGYAIIFPDSGPRLQLADAFVNDLREEIRRADRS